MRHNPLMLAAWVFGALAAVSACADRGGPSSPSEPVASCTSGQLTGPYPGGTSQAQPVGVSGGSFTVSVTVAGNCQWTVTSDVPWVAVSGGSTFSGSQNLRYTIPANAGGSRTGRLRYSFDSTTSTYIVQDGPLTCASSISPTARSFPSSQSAVEVRVFAPAGCTWAFDGNGSWLTVVPEDGRPSPWGDGNGTVLAVAAANTDSGPRTGKATIAGTEFMVTQDGTGIPACEYTFTPVAHWFPAIGGTGQVMVATGAECTWLLEEFGDPWIRPAVSGRYFRGPGVYRFTVDGNHTTASRTGMFWLSGTSALSSTRITVQQAGATCVYTVSSPSSAWGPGGGRAGVSVDARPGSCQWMAVADQPWIAVLSGASGVGGGLFEFAVAALPAGMTSTRTGTVTVRGLSGLNPPAVHTVTQSPSAGQ